MSRYRLYPTTAQEESLRSHCAHARYVWNLALEQRSYRKRGEAAPSHAQQFRQLTEARDAFPWLAHGSVVVQQQALRDFHQTLERWFRGTCRYPKWRKRDRREGFRIVGDRRTFRVEKLNRKWAHVLIPKVGWVRFRQSRPAPDAKSFRVTRDGRGHWHIAFAVPPTPVPAPGNGLLVGVDRGVAVSATLSTGESLRITGPREREVERLARLCRKAGKQQVLFRPASNRRRRTQAQINRLRGRQIARRNDWIEKTSTEVARRFDLIKLEALHIPAMTSSASGSITKPGRRVRQKAGLNRSILQQGWGMFARRLEDKAPGRVEKVDPAYTSQRCATCGHVDRNSRKSQALFCCTACGHVDNADVNAAKNIAAGRAVTARGAGAARQAMNREPQLPTSSVA